MESQYEYVIAGGGLAGAAAIEGIRERDPSGTILLLGREPDPPYDRPPLSKQLWFGKQQVEDIFLHDRAWYDAQRVETQLGRTVARLNPADRVVIDDLGNHHAYRKLLLATGGTPRRLSIPGGDLNGVCYYRTLGDYRRTRAQIQKGESVVVIGGGFIGSELAAALCHAEATVTMVFPEAYLGHRIFPESLARFLQQQYRERGVRIVDSDIPTSIAKENGRYVTRTRNGLQLESDLVVVGIGILPSIELARDAGLAVGNGIIVNDQLQTSHADIYAAGDNAFFPYAALGQSMRVEHWDNAVQQGKHAGRNMAGANEPYHYMPFFFSDLFEFGYEAVGEIDARLETFADWREENRTGVIYYLNEGRVRGAMMCNVWEQVEAARRLIRANAPATPASLRGAIG